MHFSINPPILIGLFLSKIHRMLELHICLDIISLMYKGIYYSIIYSDGRLEIA